MTDGACMVLDGVPEPVAHLHGPDRARLRVRRRADEAGGDMSGTTPGLFTRREFLAGGVATAGLVT
ncbi:MAG TPA: hypothetical protein VHH91_09295, partial [Vicinamibacterales bacterium]|nr:hypothetical protein [Vicinamibacterales bacterium]